MASETPRSEEDNTVVVEMVSVCLWAGYPVDLMSQHRRLPVIAIMSMVDRAVGLLLSLADL